MKPSQPVALPVVFAALLCASTFPVQAHGPQAPPEVRAQTDHLRTEPRARAIPSSAVHTMGKHPTISGRYAVDDYAVQVDFDNGVVRLVEAERTSVYAEVAPNIYEYTDPADGTRFGVRVLADNRIEAFQPDSNAPGTVLRLMNPNVAGSHAPVPKTSGRYVAGDYAVLIRFDGNSLSVVEPNGTTVYQEVAPDVFEYTDPDDGTRYGLKIVSSTRIDVFQPGSHAPGTALMLEQDGARQGPMAAADALETDDILVQRQRFGDLAVAAEKRYWIGKSNDNVVLTLDYRWLVPGMVMEKVIYHGHYVLRMRYKYQPQTQRINEYAAVFENGKLAVEHLENEAQVMADGSVRFGGRLAASMPAHQLKYEGEDRLVFSAVSFPNLTPEVWHALTYEQFLDARVNSVQQLDQVVAQARRKKQESERAFWNGLSTAMQVTAQVTEEVARSQAATCRNGAAQSSHAALA